MDTLNTEKSVIQTPMGNSNLLSCCLDLNILVLPINEPWLLFFMILDNFLEYYVDDISVKSKEFLNQVDDLRKVFI